MSFGIPVRNGLGIGLLASTSLSTRRGAGAVPFSPLLLFAAGEQGGWYDPSDLTTMFQDTAGTVPVTATGQTVARINDKSGRGNHLTQATAASRPIYGIEPFGGRRNLLVRTEEFDNATVWGNSITGTGVAPTVTANDGTAPDGTLTADRLQFNLGGGTASGDITRRRQVITPPAGNNTFSVYLRSYDGVSTYNMHLVDAAGATRNIVVTGAWQRFEVTATAPGTSATFAVGLRGAQTPANSNTADILAWGAQDEASATATAYQRVTDQWNVTQAGVPSVSYVQYDGTDDWFISPTITPGTNKAQVFAGVRKLVETSGMLLESSTSAQSNQGSFLFRAPSSATANYSVSSGGTSLIGATATASGYPAPITNVVSFQSDIAGPSLVLRVNNAQVASSVTSQGTGNFNAYPLYVGRRGGTSLPFNGRVYQMIVRFGANLDAATITATETFVNSKTGAY